MKSPTTAAIELPGAPVEQVAQALINRGFRHGRGRYAACNRRPHTAAIELPGAPVEPVAQALFNRGVTNFQQNQKRESQSDF